MAGGKGGGSQPSGTTTTTQNTEPWSGQQPYLLAGMQYADQLFNSYRPQYAPFTTIANETSQQGQGLTDLYSQAAGLNSNYLANAGNFSNSLLSGGALSGDPSLNVLGSLATTNYGAQNPSNPTLSAYANGAYTAANNPYTTNLANSVLANVLPSIQQQFIQGGDLSSPQAAYASSQGASAALGPLLFQRQQQEEQNQLTGASQLSQNYLGGGALQSNAAAALGGQYGTDLQRMVQGLALAPQTAQSFLIGPQQEYQVGAAQQGLNQAIINDEIQRFNYQQTLPYGVLNQFMGEIGGNYGGTTSLTQPYYINQGASALSGGLGGALLGAQLGPSIFGTSAGLGGGLGGAAGLLLSLL